MIIIPKRNLYLPEHKWGLKKFQRGIIVAAPVYAAAAVPGIVALNGIAEAVEAGAGAREIKLRFNASGIVELFRTSTGYVQKNSGTDWIIPNSSGDSSYEVRLASINFGAWTTTPAATGAWIDLGTSREWILFDDDPSPFQVATVRECVFEIRKDGGTPVASPSIPTTLAWTANRTS